MPESAVCPVVVVYATRWLTMVPDAGPVTIAAPAPARGRLRLKSNSPAVGLVIAIPPFPVPFLKLTVLEEVSAVPFC